MVINPGESATLFMEFKMPAGMGGPHDFRVFLPNNDPDWGEKAWQFYPTGLSD